MRTPDMPPTITSIVVERPGQMGTIEEETPPLEPNQIYIKTYITGISAGTALTVFRGTNAKCSKPYDEELMLFGEASETPTTRYPVREGYEEAGVVVASRDTRFPEGTKVAGQFGPRSGYVAEAGDPWDPVHPKDHIVAFPDHLDLQGGIWVAKMAAIGLIGVLDTINKLRNGAPIGELEGTLKDRRICVFGAGMVGLFAGMFAERAGAEVLVVERIPQRIETIKKLGMTPFTAQQDLSREIKERWKVPGHPKKTGPDSVIQCTDSHYMLNQALRAVRYEGIVANVGFHQGDVTGIRLGEEFHHHRIHLQSSQIGGVPAAQREIWTRRRMSQEAITLLEDRPDIVTHTLTDRIPFTMPEHIAGVQTIFKRLANNDPAVLQAAIEFHPPETQ